MFIDRHNVRLLFTVTLQFLTGVTICQASHTATQSRKFAIFFIADESTGEDYRHRSFNMAAGESVAQSAYITLYMRHESLNTLRTGDAHLRF